MPSFSAEQATRFRALLASPDAASRLEELRVLVGPLIPLRPGAPPAAAPAGDPHACNCGCALCRAQRAAAAPADADAAPLDEAAAAAALEAQAARSEAVLSRARVVTAPKSVAMWRAALAALRRA